MTYQCTTLPSGLRVASETLPHAETVTIAITVDVGARHETDAQNGLAHVLEHMAFKGTATRSALDIAETFDNIGGHSNAYTSQEQTVYYAKVLKEHAGLAVEVLLDILQHSTFDSEELARERQVILQEIAMHHDTPDDLVFDHFQAAAFPGQPLGRSILGTAAKVSGFSSDDLRSYLRDHYAPSAIVITAAGNITHDQLLAMVNAHLALTPRAPVAQPANCVYRGGEARIERELEQLHLLLGFGGISYRDDDYYTAQMLSIILGGGMSSRLFQEVREKRGLVYTIYSFTSCYRDGGLLGVYAAASPENVKDLVPVTCDQLGALTQHISDAELARAKNQQKASVLMARESTASLAEWIGRHLHNYGTYRSAAEITQRIDAVELADVKRLAARMLASPLTLTALGPCKTLESYDAVQSRVAA